MIEVLILVVSTLVLYALFQISGRLFQIRESLLQMKDANSEQLEAISWELEKIAKLLLRFQVNLISRSGSCLTTSLKSIQTTRGWVSRPIRNRSEKMEELED